MSPWKQSVSILCRSSILNRISLLPVRLHANSSRLCQPVIDLYRLSSSRLPTHPAVEICLIWAVDSQINNALCSTPHLTVKQPSLNGGPNKSPIWISSQLFNAQRRFPPTHMQSLVDWLKFSYQHVLHVSPPTSDGGGGVKGQ